MNNRILHFQSVACKAHQYTVLSSERIVVSNILWEKKIFQMIRTAVSFSTFLVFLAKFSRKWYVVRKKPEKSGANISDSELRITWYHPCDPQKFFADQNRNSAFNTSYVIKTKTKKSHYSEFLKAIKQISSITNDYNYNYNYKREYLSESICHLLNTTKFTVTSKSV